MIPVSVSPALCLACGKGVCVERGGRETDRQRQRLTESHSPRRKSTSWITTSKIKISGCVLASGGALGMKNQSDMGLTNIN